MTGFCPVNPLDADGYEPANAAVPCPFPAGSTEKLEAMRLRHECGKSLWHSDDCKRVVINADTAADRLRTLLAGLHTVKGETSTTELQKLNP